MNNLKKSILSLMTIVTCICCLNAQLHIVADKFDATYEAGELMHFLVTSPTTGTANYTIRFDQRSPILVEGTIDLVAGRTTRIPFQEFEPNFVLCHVTQFGSSDVAAAAFSPYDIAPHEDEPADFDAFWDSMKAQLASIPMDTQITQYSNTNLSTTYQINMANIEGRRVYGYMTIPNGNGPFPATLVMPPFGSGPNHTKPENYVAEQTGMIVFSLSIHNALPDVGDNNAYQPNHYDQKEGNYYKYGLLGAVRAIDYIYSRPEFDGTNMMVMGVSQGGGLSISVAGLDQRIKVMINSISALCQHSGLRYGKTAGHPYFIFKSRTENGSPIHEANTVQATKYYDAMNFAKRFKGTSLTYMSYEDVTCPPGTVFAANNQLQNSKVIFHRREEGHDSPDYWLGRFDFIRAQFPTTQNAPVGTNTNTGYQIVASADMTAAVNTPITISATITNNTIPQSYPVYWEKVSGPGGIQFSNAEQVNTTTQFDTAGEYLLRITATDRDFPEGDAKWVSLVDYVKVVVE